MRTLYLLGLASFVWLNSASSLLAQPTSSPASQGASSERAPSTLGAGTRTGEGGGACSVEQSGNSKEGSGTGPNPVQTEQANAKSPTLMALIPQTRVTLTTQERVELYVYIPPETNKAAVLEIIDNRTGYALFEAGFELNTADVIARFVLPETVTFAVNEPAAHPLDNPYEWRLLVYCDLENNQDISVAGWINRLESGEDEIPLNLWHDGLEAAFAERKTNPAAWQQSLAAEALADYADLAVETYVFVLGSQASSSATGGL